MLTNNSTSRRLLDTMLCYNLRQIIKTPTRDSNSSSSCIDLVFTNDMECSVEVQDNGISDHKSILLTIETQATQIKPKPWFTHSRIFSEKNKHLFKQGLKSINWNDVLSVTKDINANFQRFHNILQQNLNKYIPRRRIKLFTSTQNKTWLTKGLRLSCKHKRQLKTFLNISKK